MRKIFVLALFLALPLLAFSQGVFVGPFTSFKVVNGITMPNSNATITVCAAGASGIPCSPALTNTVYSNIQLTVPLSNPFTADANGNYSFTVAPGNYTITETASGFAGKSFQVSPGGGTSSGTVTGATPNGGLLLSGSTLGLLTSCIAPQVELFNGTAWICGRQIPITTVAGLGSVFGATNGSLAVVTDSASGACNAGSGSITVLCLYNGSTWSGVSATTVPFSGLTSGTNTAGIFNVGGSLAPSSAGQVQGNQIILQSGLPQVVATAALTGGTLISGRAISIRYTLNTAAGETLPSVWYNVSNSSIGCSSGTTCSVTVTAPTIPAGYTGYTVYSQDCGSLPCGGGTELRQIALAACVNITTSCVIGTAGTGAALPTANTAVLQPPSITTNNCPDGVIPQVFLQRADGTYFGLAGVDSSTGNPLPTPDGTLTFCGRLFINDTGQSLLNASQQGGGPIKTDLVTIAHKAGRLFTPSSAIDDRAWSVRASDVASGTDTFHQFLGYYGEQFVYNPNFQCNPIGPGTGAGEDCIANIRARADLQVATTAPVTGILGGHFTAATDIAAPNLGSCGPCVVGVAGTADQEGVANQSTSASYAGVTGFANAFGTSAGGAFGVAFWAIPPATRFTGSNIGLYIPGGFSNTTVDYAIRSDATSPSKFQGSLDLGAANAIVANAAQSIGVTGSLAVTGGVGTAQLGTPAQPSITNGGTPGSTSYTYDVCVVDAAGGAVCGNTNSTATGNATLSSSNYNRISISCSGADLPGASSVNVYRTISGGTPSSTGKIGVITQTDISGQCNGGAATIFLDDKALAGDSTTPSVGNTTGGLQAFKYSTLTNCAVNSASPAACGSSSSGAVVIPTTTATYTVNTTAVTTHSRILLTWLTFASDLPSSPTCVAPSTTSMPTISAVSTGVSFTIALTSTTGQTCPQFEIVN